MVEMDATSGGSVTHLTGADGADGVTFALVTRPGDQSVYVGITAPRLQCATWLPLPMIDDLIDALRSHKANAEREASTDA